MGLDNPPGYQYLNYVLPDKVHLCMVRFVQRADTTNFFHFIRFLKASSHILKCGDDILDVDAHALFNHRHMGFVELLRLNERFKYLNFADGITDDKPADAGATTTNRKEMT